MTIVIVPVAVVAALLILTAVLEVFTTRDVSDKPGKSKKQKLSRASKEILKEYRSLPIESRPYADLTSLLAALDTKHPRVEVDKHFSNNYWGDSPHFTWDTNGSRCTHDSCKYKDYYGIHKGIQEVILARKNQAHALAVAGVQADLDEVKSLTARLREERDIINQVTKELI